MIKISVNLFSIIIEIDYFSIFQVRDIHLLQTIDVFFGYPDVIASLVSMHIHLNKNFCSGIWKNP